MMATDIYSTLPPELVLQQQQQNRQQEMAKALLAQGAQQNQNPAGQMVSGRYVPNSFFQNLQGPVNQMLGAYMAQKGDEQAQKTAQALRDYYKEEALGFAKKVKENPEEAYIEYSTAYNPAIAKTATERMTRGQKWEKIEKLDNRGNTVTYMMDVNSPNPESTLRMVGVSKQAISPAEAARLNWEGIPYGGGGAVGGGQTPVGQISLVGGQPTMNVQGGGQPSMQSNAPTQPLNLQSAGLMPPLITAGMSPKAIQEAKTAYAQDLQTNIKNAYDVYKVASEIEKTLPKAHGSGIGNIVGGIQNFVGIESNKNAADAELKVMADKLLKAVPRFSGPQSDKDVASYKEAAGAIGDASLPMNVRMAALNRIKQMNMPYAPNLDWTSEAPITTKQTFWSGEERMSPSDFKANLSGQDKEAFDWARKNPNDPRSTEIKNRLGIK